MEEPITFSASDLIHLYLDGEADNLQQSMLFGRLAGSSELQAEFTEALQIRAAIEHERTHTVVPANVTQSLFEKAGFAAPAPEIIAPALGTVGPFRGFLGRLGVPVLSAIGSALLTMLLLTQDHQNQYDELNASLQQIRAERAIDSARLSRVQLKASSPVLNNSSISKKSQEIAPARSTAPERTAITRIVRETPRVTASAQPPHHESPVRTQVTVSGPEMTQNAVAMHSIAETKLRTAPPVSPEQGIHKDDIHTSGERLSATDVLPAFAERDGQMHRFSLQLREITDMRYFPDQSSENESQPAHSNLNIGVLYQLSEHHAIGLEGGREYLPLYRSEGDAFTLKPYLAWAAGTYRLRPGAFDDAGLIQPFLQASLGGTPSGPIGRAIMGIGYTPGGHIDFSMGIEGTSLLYQLRDNWYATGKMGVTYMMNVHF